MVLLQLGKAGHECRLEIDGVEISKRVCGLDIEAHVGSLTLIRLTLLDDVVVMGEPGRWEFVKREESQP